MKRRSVIQSLFFISLLGYFTACSPIIVGRYPYPVPEERGRGEENYRLAGVPPGHLPPPGHCRVWYPGRPPGHQPPPFRCGAGRYDVPLGAWLLSRVDQNNVEVDEYDEKVPDVIKRSYVHRLD